MVIGADSELPVALQAALKYFDTNGDGDISVEDLMRAGEIMKARKGDGCGHFSMDAFPENLKEMLAPIDTDGDGSVSIAEFAAAMKAYEAKKKEAKRLWGMVFGLVAKTRPDGPESGFWNWIIGPDPVKGT